MKKLITISLIALLVAISVSPQRIEADIPSKPLTIQETIVKQVVYYAASEKKLTALLRCESHFNQDVIGAEGEIGVGQFKQGTFDYLSDLMGETLNIHSYADQIKLIAWTSVNTPKEMNHWTTWRALQNGGIYTFTSKKTGKTYTVTCKE